MEGKASTATARAEGGCVVQPLTTGGGEPFAGRPQPRVAPVALPRAGAWGRRVAELLSVLRPPVREDHDPDWDPQWGIVNRDGVSLLRDDTYMLDAERQALVELLNLIEALPVDVALDLDGYQRQAARFAHYPRVGSNLAYTALGLAGEAGEVANEVKKVERDDFGRLTETRAQKLRDELGDALWYVAACATELGVYLADIADDNLRKLRTRQEER